jgi:hypothetical protein
MTVTDKDMAHKKTCKYSKIIHDSHGRSGSPNCITENVTMRRIVASGKMLLSDRRKRQSEEQHDEPEK